MPLWCIVTVVAAATPVVTRSVFDPTVILSGRGARLQARRRARVELNTRCTYLLILILTYYSNINLLILTFLLILTY